MNGVLRNTQARRKLTLRHAVENALKDIQFAPGKAQFSAHFGPSELGNYLGAKSRDALAGVPFPGALTACYR